MNDIEDLTELIINTDLRKNIDDYRIKNNLPVLSDLEWEETRPFHEVVIKAMVKSIFIPLISSSIENIRREFHILRNQVERNRKNIENPKNPNPVPGWPARSKNKKFL